MRFLVETVRGTRHFQKLGKFTRIILWDVDSRDWTKPGAKRIENSVVASVRPGSVVLFHDGGGDRRQTIKALPGIIRRLKNRGYTFVTVDELSQLRAEAAAKRRAAKKSPKKPAGKKRSAVPAASPPG